MGWKEQNWIAILFPQESACHVCERGLEEDDILCPYCKELLDASKLHPVTQILDRSPSITACVSAWKHASVPRRLVHLLKYESDARAAQTLAAGMAKAMRQGPPKLYKCDLVIPVPLHPDRFRERGYNQALLLAKEICSQSDLCLADDVLLRLQNTKSLVGRGREQRLLMMQNVFAVSKGKDISGLTILLVDDVLTTGATSSACASALLAAGAKEVCLLTATRAQRRPIYHKGPTMWEKLKKHYKKHRKAFRAKRC